MIYLMVVIVLSIILIVISYIGILQDKDREKTSPFECGFDPSGRSRRGFSIRFYLIAIIFLVFDVEIVLLFPIILIELNQNKLIIGLVFLLVLILGVIYE